LETFLRAKFGSYPLHNKQGFQQLGTAKKNGANYLHIYVKDKSSNMVSNDIHAWIVGHMVARQLFLNEYQGLNF